MIAKTTDVPVHKCLRPAGTQGHVKAWLHTAAGVSWDLQNAGRSSRASPTAGDTTAHAFLPPSPRDTEGSESRILLLPSQQDLVGGPGQDSLCLSGLSQ